MLRSSLVEPSEDSHQIRESYDKENLPIKPSKREAARVRQQRKRNLAKMRASAALKKATRTIKKSWDEGGRYMA